MPGICRYGNGNSAIFVSHLPTNQFRVPAIVPMIAIPSDCHLDLIESFSRPYKICLSQ